MTIEEFTSLASLYRGLFTPEEFQDIVLMLTKKDYQPTIFYHQVPRNSKKEIHNQIHRCYGSSMYIALLQPILILTQKQYEIRVRFLVDQFETRTTYSDYIWKPIIRMASGLEVEFHRDSTLEYDISTTGCISRLGFNEYEKLT